MTNSITHAAHAALGTNQTYCFDGDSVRVSADVSFGDEVLRGSDRWWLQLWATPSGFDAGLSGVKVAELAVDARPGRHTVEAVVEAFPPAGSEPQAMGVALVSVGADGRSSLRDLSVFPRRECFVQPRIEGEASCRVADGRAEISVAGVVNPRAADNLSGTLALEIWAIDEPYTGGSWVGSLVASTTLGALAGASAWSEARYSVPAAAVQGSWHTLMLREWTAQGYVTRDFRNFPAHGPSGQAATPAVAEPVASAGSAAPEPAPPATKATKRAAAAAKSAEVAVNSATEADLAGIKGIGASLARAIVAARPFATLEDLCRAKGMGPKLLERVRAYLKL